MELAKNFPHSEAESRWYAHWERSGYFHSEPDHRAPYTIVMPPPNVTGILHMGHALNNSVQDILIRRAKSAGFNTCWVPGTDHASIATEAKVVAMLSERGIAKSSLNRDEFLRYAWEWKEKYGGIILQQLRRLGCALDWDRTNFTMDPDYYAAVIRIFVELHGKGLIYRGARMINWDPQAKTALSDEEVEHRQTQSRLFYVSYRLDGEPGGEITVATVRPETILGDTAICVHPDDERYRHLAGRFCFVPLIGRRIPIIFDDYIDPEFGTGALKVTPAHDINDYNLGLKHKLPVIDTLNEDGTMSEAAGLYVGQDRFAVRKQIVADLAAAGNLVREEPYTNQVGYSERTQAVIEPRLSMQWWCRMDDLADPALRAVMDDTIRFFPPKYRNLYRHWMENIKDWCISRQLSWGHRIPAWYDGDGNVYVAASEEEARRQCALENPQSSILHQDEDCLDTWFSSWLWPMEVFGWNKSPANGDLAYYYPTTTLVTAPEIIFFWVARMIMAGYHFKEEKPFSQVYFTGIVRDKQGRKMSKSLGNSPDLLALIDEWGTDAVRFSVMISSPAGNDLLYDESALEQGRNFCNKLWNAMRLVKGWESRLSDAPVSPEAAFAAEWMEARITQVAASLRDMFTDFRLSEALKTIYSLIWDDFCSWYLEWAKPGMDMPVSSGVYHRTLRIFDDLLTCLHPFLPFVTEEIYHLLSERPDRDDLMLRQLAESATLSGTHADETAIAAGDRLKEIITAVRDSRIRAGLKPRDPVEITVQTTDNALYERADSLLRKAVNASAIRFLATGEEGGGTAIVIGSDKVYLHSEKEVDTEAQQAQLRKEMDYLQGFLKSVEKKLSNERFVASAKPEIVEAERKKQSDALMKIRALEESLRLV